MISFKILESFDLDYSNFDYKSHFDKIVVGKSKRASLVIEDPSIPPLHFTLFLDNENLLVKTLSNEMIHINGKRLKGTKLLKKGDLLKFNKNTFLITDFSPLTDESDDLEKLYKNAIQECPELKEIISLLERELLYLESKQNVQE